MYMHSSGEESSHSASEELPVYEESQFTNKYLFQSTPNTHTKYHNISIPKKTQPTRNSLQSHTFGLVTQPQFRHHHLQSDQEPMANTDHNTDHQAQRLKMLLQREIEKNRELEKELFLRQKELISLRTRDKPLRKSPIVNRAASPVSHLKIQHIRQIQQELDKLKLQVSKNSINKQKLQQLKNENSKLKKTNQKYKQFVEGISMSLGIMTKRSPPKGLKQTWKVWKEVFSERARDHHQDK